MIEDGRLFFLIDDPQFTYPDSENPYFDKLKSVEEFAYVNSNAEKNKGQWQSLFADKKNLTATCPPLHVEIGCNGGHVTLGWAKRTPEARFIGLDYKYKQIYLGAEKAQKLSLKNLLFVRGHASRLPFLFAPSEIDALYLFFPDPWPKKRHQKNRFFQEGELRKIYPLLKPGAVFEIRTDHCAYFEWMLSEAQKAADLFEVVELSYDRHGNGPEASKLEIPDVTLFEKLFIKDHQAVHLLKLKAKKQLKK